MSTHPPSRGPFNYSHLVLFSTKCIYCIFPIFSDPWVFFQNQPFCGPEKKPAVFYHNLSRKQLLSPPHPAFWFLAPAGADAAIWSSKERTFSNNLKWLNMAQLSLPGHLKNHLTQTKNLENDPLVNSHSWKLEYPSIFSIGWNTSTPFGFHFPASELFVDPGVSFHTKKTTTMGGGWSSDDVPKWKWVILYVSMWIQGV